MPGILSMSKQHGLGGRLAICAAVAAGASIYFSAAAFAALPPGVVPLPFNDGKSVGTASLRLSSDDSITVGVSRYVPSGTGAQQGGWLVGRFDANGQPNKNFSFDGFDEQMLGPLSGIGDAAVDSNGKVVSGGALLEGLQVSGRVQRYKNDGAIDNTFAGNSIRMLNRGAAIWVNKVLPQSDGKLLVVAGSSAGFGTADFELVVYRLNTDGTLDTTFSGDGLATVSLGTGSTIIDAQQQKDGKLLVLTSRKVSPASAQQPAYRAVAARFTTAGQLDTAFGTRGFAVPTTDAYSEVPGDLTVASDGSIFVASISKRTSDLKTSANELLVAKLKTNGVADSSFGSTSGVKVVATEAAGNVPTSGADVAVLTDGKVVASYNQSRTVGGKSQTDATLVGLTPAGTVDSSFATAGKLLLDLNGEDNQLQQMQTDSKGRAVILTGYRSGANQPLRAALLRVTTTGFDSSFGSGASVVVDKTAPQLTKVKLAKKTLYKRNGLRRTVLTANVDEKSKVMAKISRRNGNKSYTVIRTAVFYGGPGTVSRRVSAVGLKPGVYKVTVRAKDSAGNLSKSRSIWFRVKQQPFVAG